MFRRSGGPFRRERNGAQAPKGRVSGMRRATRVYIEIHEDPEHRRDTRSRAQQIFSQALRALESAPVGVLPAAIRLAHHAAVHPDKVRFPASLPANTRRSIRAPHSAVKWFNV